jgi:hypothetical protein
MQEPAVIRRVRVAAHELIIDDIIAHINLAVSFTLTVVPDPNASSREHGLNAQQVFHLARFEDPALRVDQRNAVAAELKDAQTTASAG